MAESKFIKHQDKNGDLLIDECQDIIEEIKKPKCKGPGCVPNPHAVVPDWRDKTKDEPFANDKNCKYQISLTTRYESTNPSGDFILSGSMSDEQAEENIQTIYDEFIDTATEYMLLGFGKEASKNNIDLLKPLVSGTDYYLHFRPTSKLKILYSVDKDSFDSLEFSDEDAQDDTPDEQASSGTSTEVTYKIEDLAINLIKVRKSLRLYNRYLKVFRGIKNGNLVFEGDNRIFNLKNYGDTGTAFGKSVLGDILKDLDKFLNIHGINIAGLGTVGISKDQVTKVQFTFNGNYRLTKLRVWTEGCGSKPTVFKKKKLESLKNSSSFKDRTAMAYLSKLNDMVNDLSAREPMPWIEFLIKHTYPTIQETFGYPLNQPEPLATGGSCLAEALLDEGKQLGQDILDPMFSIGDIVAFQFHQNMCVRDRVELRAMRQSIGGVYDTRDVNTTSQDSNYIEQMALEQAYQTISRENNPFDVMCLAFNNSDSQINSAGQTLSDLWANSFSNLKMCGLVDFMLEGIKCLMAGLTLDQALSKVILAALQGMNIENFGKLFVGLPESVQNELEEKVRNKLASGDILAAGTEGQRLSSAIEGDFELSNERLTAQSSNNVRWHRPWQNQNIVDQQATVRETERSSQSESPYASDVAPPEERLLGEKILAPISAEVKNQYSTNVILQAYIVALMETYQDDYLSLIDKLNKFPGSQIIVKIFQTLECPRAPLVDPSVMDFIKSVELPFCRSTQDITLPRFNNPSFWKPIATDLSRIISVTITQILKQLILKILIALFAKLCKLLGSLACKTLGLVGNVAGNLPDITTNRDTFKNAIRNGICGQNASEEQVEKTIQEILKTLGVGAAALSDTEQVNNFTSDLSLAVTPKEMMSAFLGDPSEEFLRIAESLINNNYPQFAEGLPNRRDIGSFFDNCGNLFPADFNNQMRQFLEQAPDDQGPAHPSLCADPDAVDEFCELRASILVNSGRATYSQAMEMCRADTERNLDDLKDLSDIFQQMENGLGDYINSQMPPLVSDPGCDNGIIPYETEEMIASSTMSLGGEIEKLKTAFSTDMLGNGPGEGNWGMMNMMLSDTMGNPLTAHYRKSSYKDAYVDFYQEVEEVSDGDLQLNIPIYLQYGAYPYEFARWLQVQLFMMDPSLRPEGSDLYNSIMSEDGGFNSSNSTTTSRTRSSFENYGFYKNSFGKYNFNLFEIPIRRYNIDYNVDYIRQQIVATENPRKANPDITLAFNNNNDGHGTETTVPSFGFKIQSYFSDSDGVTSMPGDNIRVMIVDVLNDQSAYIPDVIRSMNLSELTGISFGNPEDNRYEEIRYEFFATDTTLNDIIPKLDNEKYYEFITMFGGTGPGYRTPSPLRTLPSTNFSVYMPQVVLLSQMLGISKEIAKTFHDNTMTKLFELISKEIAQQSDNPIFNYGAQYDSLTREDTDYLIPEGYDDYGELYSKGEIEDVEQRSSDDEPQTYKRKIKNSDGILGISRDQYNNMTNDPPTPEDIRVFYLDPSKFGGTYMNPPVYIKPLANKGWLGLLETLFPDLSPCGSESNKSTEVIDFQEIQDIIDDVYPNIAEDQRLKSDPECVIELPFDRILERYSTAGIEGVIRAACKIYAATHIIKALPVFVKFKPSFDNVVSSVYASYIVEEMESAFKDAQGDFAEKFNPFKDDEFWFAFLEQAVQMYGRKVDEGEITDVPVHIRQALASMRAFQQNYKSVYPKRKYDPDEISNQGNRSQVTLGQYLDVDKNFKIVPRTKTFKNYKDEKNLEAVYKNANQAKVILTELMIHELNVVGEKIIKSLKDIDLGPDRRPAADSEYSSDLTYWTDTSNYVFNKLTTGCSLDLEKSLQEEYVDLPTEENPDPNNEGLEFPGPYYTSGGEFSDENGNEYIGYYHAHIENDGNMVYMKGEYHVDEPHQKLNIMINKVSVPIGSVQEYGSVTQLDEDTFYSLEKYIKINGTKYSPTQAMSIINGSASTTEVTPSEDELTMNISDIYPGTLEHVLDPLGSGEIIGLRGELGVRYGLQFSTYVQNVKKQIAIAEVDALDTKINQFQSFDNNSKLLLCLINKLKENDDFKLATKYVFSISKVVGLMAIYVDQSMLESIGQISTPLEQTYGPLATIDTKPGMSISDIELVEDEFGNIIGADATTNGIDGWAHPIFRSMKSNSPFIREWDEWDKVILKNSKSAIKRIFKQYYFERNFEKTRRDSMKGGDMIKMRLKEGLKPKFGKQLLPRFKRKNLRSNPFDPDGNICD